MLMTTFPNPQAFQGNPIRAPIPIKHHSYISREKSNPAVHVLKTKPCTEELHPSLQNVPSMYTLPYTQEQLSAPLSQNEATH
jgi:hypothetical protein